MAAGDADAEGQLARLEGLQAEAGLDGFLEDELGGFRGDFFDFHAAGGGGHEDGLARGAVEDDAEVEFALDGQRFFDEQRCTMRPSGPVWWVTSVMPRIFGGDRAASSAFLATLTPPPLPRPPAWICALTTTLPPRRSGGQFGFGHGVNHFAAGHRHAVARKRALAWYSWIFIVGV